MREIKIDFDNPGLPQRLDVVENDAQSRFFKAVLYKDGKAYAAPSGATYSIMYRGFGPQNEGWYDTINDGAGKRAACSVSGNVVTCEIARQALRVPGHVSVVLCVTGSNGYMLHGWPIDCNCRNDSYTGGTSVESFFYITQVTNADWTSAIQTWEELKNMIDPTLSLSGKAADAAKVGEAVGQLKGDLWENPSVYSPFELGTLINGEIANVKYRIVSTNIIHTTSKLYIAIGKNRRAGIHYYDSNGKFLYDSKWQTLEYAIPENSYFRIVISAFPKTGENELLEYKANVNTLLEYVKFNPICEILAKNAVKDIVKKLSKREKITFYDYFETNEWTPCNNWNNGELTYTDTNSRLGLLNIMDTETDINLSVEKGRRLGVAYFDENGKFVKDPGWQKRHVFIPKNSHVKFLISHTDVTNDDEFEEYADANKYLKYISFENFQFFNKKINAYPFSTNVSLETIVDTQNLKRMQGGVFANGYLYYAKTDDTIATIYKYDLASKTEVLSASGNYGHAGDMTYNSAKNLIVVIHGGTSETNIWFLSPETLELVSSKTVLTAGRRIGGIAYIGDSNEYVLELSKDGVWNNYSFAICDNDFNIKLEFEPIKNGYLMQGIECNNNFIYSLYAFPNIVIVYDLNGNYVGCHKIDISTEPEFITLNGDEIIIGSDGDGIIRKATRKYLWE
nr:MAG TPA: BppU domain protein [Caudoviricetes sp.]